MTDRIDLVDWAAVAAVGALARAAWHLAEVEDPVRFTLEEMSSSVEVDGIADEVSAALREAREAGLRERIDVLDCDACGERHMTERGAALVAENRELRRELAARRAVDGWLGESNSRYLEVGILSGLLNAVERHRDVDGVVAAGATYPSLAAALGLEVE